MKNLLTFDVQTIFFLQQFVNFSKTITTNFLRGFSMLCKSIFSIFLCFFCTAMSSTNNSTSYTHNPYAPTLISIQAHNPYAATLVPSQDKKSGAQNQNLHPNQNIDPKNSITPTKSQTYLGRKERFQKLSEIAELEAYRQNRNRR
jgi:hypothetical protein